MIFAFVLIGIGLLLTTIGGFIAMIRHPSAFNDHSRANFDPVRKGIPRDAINAFGRAQLHDPKAKWFTRIGLAATIAGLLLIYTLGHSSKEDEQPPINDVNKSLSH